MTDTTANNEPHTFHGVGIDRQKHFQEWWSKARQHEEPPSPFDFLVNFGLDPSQVEKMFGRVVENWSKQNTYERSR